MEKLHKESGGDSFCLHGGECTLIKRPDFEAILKKMYDLQGYSSLQTNCYKIDADMIRIFKTYKTSVGVSIDGDGELNSLRGFPTDKNKNRRYTRQTIKNMITLQEQGVSVGIIIVLTKTNASSSLKLKKLLQFILMLRSKNLKGGRLNIMWSNDTVNKKYELTPEEASYAWLYLYNNLKQYNDLQWQPFRDFTDNLLGFGHSSCSYGKCDYFSTITSVILADGSLGNCDRTHQEGCIYTRATQQPTYERYTILKQTQCKSCRYWECCYAGCPAEGLNGDWRNKTRYCKAVYDLYSAIENDIKAVFPNVTLITAFKGEEDYFDSIRKGIYHEPFDKMSWITALNPSTWRNVTARPLQTYQDSNVRERGDLNCRA
jgi:hypothetical protein